MSLRTYDPILGDFITRGKNNGVVSLHYSFSNEGTEPKVARDAADLMLHVDGSPHSHNRSITSLKLIAEASERIHRAN